MNHKRFRTSHAMVKGLGLLVVLALGMLWAPAPSLAEDLETFSYTVQAGDTLFRLSQRFGTTVDVLVELNNIANPDLIYVGQVLLVPVTGQATAPAPSAPAGGGPLAFTWERIAVRYEGRDYLSTFHVVPSGGQPPYTYYHDGVVLADAASPDGRSATFEVASRRGFNKPGSVGVADATGNYVKQEYWLKDPCDYPFPGVVITEPDEDEVLRSRPRNFNIEWEHPDAPPDAYWIEIQVLQDDEWEPFATYFHRRGKSELFYVPDPFPGALRGRLRMWGVYGVCESRDETPWRHFEFR